jgi:hypothetical protein
MAALLGVSHDNGGSSGIYYAVTVLIESTFLALAKIVRFSPNCGRSNV